MSFFLKKLVPVPKSSRLIVCSAKATSIVEGMRKVNLFMASRLEIFTFCYDVLYDAYMRIYYVADEAYGLMTLLIVIN